MAVRRVRPSQPLAPHGLPGHLVGFVEALRGQGIAVGPSETVDAGKVLAVLGLGDREVLTANAYLGGWGIAEALARGADIVITGRVTDAALTVGPAAWQHGWRREDMVTADEILDALTPHFKLTAADPGERGSAPAETFLVDGGPARVGVIGSVTRPFCGTCDRVRLTADGQIRSCLFSTEETDLRGLLRHGADDDAIEAAWRAAMWAKPAGHGINDPGFTQPDRPMSSIGG